MTKRAIGYVPELGREGVQRACLDLLSAERIWHRRLNTGTFVIPGDGNRKRRIFRAGSKGMADILATPFLFKTTPSIVWIETKSSEGSQREAQREFQQEVERAGHIYLLIRDAQQLIKWLRQHRAI